METRRICLTQPTGNPPESWVIVKPYTSDKTTPELNETIGKAKETIRELEAARRKTRLQLNKLEMEFDDMRLNNSTDQKRYRELLVDIESNKLALKGHDSNVDQANRRLVKLKKEAETQKKVYSYGDRKADLERLNELHESYFETLVRCLEPVKAFESNKKYGQHIYYALNERIRNLIPEMELALNRINDYYAAPLNRYEELSQEEPEEEPEEAPKDEPDEVSQPVTKTAEFKDEEDNEYEIEFTFPNSEQLRELDEVNAD